jgi:hypothetical protein
MSASLAAETATRRMTTGSPGLSMIGEVFDSGRGLSAIAEDGPVGAVAWRTRGAPKRHATSAAQRHTTRIALRMTKPPRWVTRRPQTLSTRGRKSDLPRAEDVSAVARLKSDSVSDASSSSAHALFVPSAGIRLTGVNPKDEFRRGGSRG